jgi:meiotically up-regulated gene 157 (Mug157) protein
VKVDPAIFLLPDAGPLITLAYADALDVLFKPGWSVQIVDMVLHEITRNQTPTSDAIAAWIKANKLHVVPTKTLKHFQHAQSTVAADPRKSNLGELAIQEAMNDFALINPPPTGVFLFEDHKIARTSFMLPANCRKVSTRAFLIFVEQKGWLESAAEVERKAILSGRNFSQLRFPAS